MQTTDWNENRVDNEYWISKDGKKPFQLTNTSKGSSSSLAFSPDGQWIAFLADRGNKTQIHVMRVEGGEPMVITKEEEQKVKLAAKNLLHRLREEKPTVLINDWYKDTQTRFQVQTSIKKALNDLLPVSYDRAIYSTKCDVVFDHFLRMAQNEQAWASA